MKRVGIKYLSFAAERMCELCVKWIEVCLVRDRIKPDDYLIRFKLGVIHVDLMCVISDWILLKLI